MKEEEEKKKKRRRRMKEEEEKKKKKKKKKEKERKKRKCWRCVVRDTGFLITWGLTGLFTLRDFRLPPRSR